MSGEERRKKIIEYIKSETEPVSGTKLAKLMGVSRQVIVQDVALIRAKNIDIVSTYRGYIINEPDSVMRVVHVKHTADEMGEELSAIVDAGGKILDVFVKHPVYGKLSAPIEVYSRADVASFLERMKRGEATPLSKMTDGEHYHTILGYSEKILDDVETALLEKGFLAEDKQP